MKKEMIESKKNAVVLRQGRNTIEIIPLGF